MIEAPAAPYWCGSGLGQQPHFLLPIKDRCLPAPLQTRWLSLNPKGCCKHHSWCLDQKVPFQRDFGSDLARSKWNRINYFHLPADLPVKQSDTHIPQMTWTHRRVTFQSCWMRLRYSKLYNTAIVAARNHCKTVLDHNEILR